MKIPRQVLFLLALAGLSLTSAYLKRENPAHLSYLADPPLVFHDLRKAAQSSSDLNMMQSLAASVKGHERLFDPSTPFTVFVPRNLAFANVPRSLLNDIWIPNGRLWSRIFWHHVAEGNYRKEDLANGQTLKQLDGETVRIEVRDGRISVDDHPVVGMLLTHSSVIYVIDSLLVPESAKQEFGMRKY